MRDATVDLRAEFCLAMFMLSFALYGGLFIRFQVWLFGIKTPRPIVITAMRIAAGFVAAGVVFIMVGDLQTHPELMK